MSVTGMQMEMGRWSREIIVVSKAAGQYYARPTMTGLTSYIHIAGPRSSYVELYRNPQVCWVTANCLLKATLVGTTSTPARQKQNTKYPSIYLPGNICSTCAGIGTIKENVRVLARMIRKMGSAWGQVGSRGWYLGNSWGAKHVYDACPAIVILELGCDLILISAYIR